MDEIDEANAAAELFLAAALRAARTSALPPAGLCLNCDADLTNGPGGRFCDADCREDYEHRERVTRRQGVSYASAS